MDIPSLIISFFAFALSLFTFYWTSIREKRDFYLLRLDRMAGSFTPEFALVNAGSKHILVTTIECGFEKDDNGAYYPNQAIRHGKDETLLIESGRAIHCIVDFLENLPPEFVKEGKLRDGTLPDMYMFKFKINLSWVDAHGDSYEGSVHVNDYGFLESGKLCLFSPAQRKHDLLKVAKLKS